MNLYPGDSVTVEAPNGEWIEGIALRYWPDIEEEPFEVLEAASSKIVTVEKPWDCEIEVVRKGNG